MAANAAWDLSYAAFLIIMAMLCFWAVYQLWKGPRL